MTEIPKEMKQATWIFYMRAKDLNPAICITGTRQYISHLVNMFTMAEITEYDSLINDCIKIVNNALYQLSEEKNPGKAFQDVMPALDKSGQFAYNIEYSTIDMTSFKGVKK
jgi:hypothetical protein